MKCSHISSASSLVRRNGRNQGEIFLGIYPKKEGAMVFIGLCAKMSETAAYSPSMFALVSSSPLILACDISLQTGWIDLVKRCGCFLLLDGRYSPLAEVVPVLFQCSTAPTSHSRIDSIFKNMLDTWSE